MENKTRYTVIMADDDEDDCLIAKESFFESGARADFACVGDGVALLDYLLEHSRSEPQGLPTLILLDLNMPRKDGRQTLREIKAEPAFKDIPIVIFTTSSEKKDISFALKSGADLFITKPNTYDKWVNIMKSLAGRWLNNQRTVEG